MGADEPLKNVYRLNCSSNWLAIVALPNKVNLNCEYFNMSEKTLTQTEFQHRIEPQLDIREGNIWIKGKLLWLIRIFDKPRWGANPVNKNYEYFVTLNCAFCELHTLCIILGSTSKYKLAWIGQVIHFLLLINIIFYKITFTIKCTTLT